MVDGEIMSPLGLQDILHKVHTELSFYPSLDGGRLIAKAKKSAKGRQGPSCQAVDHFGAGAFAALRGRYRKRDVADDDLHDACAALWTAERIFRRTARRIPLSPVTDARGLRMEMWY